MYNENIVIHGYKKGMKWFIHFQVVRRAWYQREECVLGINLENNKKKNRGERKRQRNVLQIERRGKKCIFHSNQLVIGEFDRSRCPSTSSQALAFAQRNPCHKEKCGCVLLMLCAGRLRCYCVVFQAFNTYWLDKSKWSRWSDRVQ